MQVASDVISLIEALGEPTLLVQPDRLVVYSSRSANALGCDALIGQGLRSHLKEDDSKLQEYLGRCIGSTSPLVGALALCNGDGVSRYQTRGSRVSLNGRTAILLRLGRADEVHFRALTLKIAELDAEVKERQKAQAILHEALKERELLLRELQHRVKNNMHMLAGMLLGAEREAIGAEAKAALKDASLRFSAVSAVQQLLYSNKDIDEIESEALVSTLVHAAAMTSKETNIEVEVDHYPIPLDSAVPIALILNELLTNAIKYGRPSEGQQCLHVKFKCDQTSISLFVKDNGPGFDLRETGKRASGIGLVRGLLRQLSGSISVTQDGGAKCTATFPLPRRRTGGRP